MKLRKYLTRKKIICFDIDGIICKSNKGDYKKSKPILKNISLINNYFKDGHFIKIFTSRYMGRNNEKVKLAKKKGLKLTKMQLRKWNVKYHKLIMGKPSYDYFIDDKAFNSTKDFKKKIKL